MLKNAVFMNLYRGSMYDTLNLRVCIQQNQRIKEDKKRRDDNFLIICLICSFILKVQKIIQDRGTKA